MIEAAIQVFEARQRSDFQVSQGVSVKVQVDYLASGGRVFVAGTRPKGDGLAGGNRDLRGVADQGGAIGDLEGDKAGGGLSFDEVSADASIRGVADWAVGCGFHNDSTA